MNNILVKRYPTSYQIAEVNENALSNIHWSDISGGARVRMPNTMLCGYMDYSEAVDSGIIVPAGRDDNGYNDVKVCVCKNDNDETAEYYRMIVQADYNKHSYRWTDYKKTKSVAECIKQHSRGIGGAGLVEMLKGQVDERHIKDALKILDKAGYLKVVGSRRSPNALYFLDDCFTFQENLLGLDKLF